MGYYYVRYCAIDGCDMRTVLCRTLGDAVGTANRLVIDGYANTAYVGWSFRASNGLWYASADSSAVVSVGRVDFVGGRRVVSHKFVGVR
jgi:hypothetical protein